MSKSVDGICKKISITRMGSGGLSTAYFSAMGHKPTTFENRSKLDGLRNTRE